jgi:hypothetical protein
MRSCLPALQSWSMQSSRDFTVQQKMEQSLHFQEAALMSPVLS